MKALAGLALGGACALALYGQGPLVFEVVSIKLSPPADALNPADTVLAPALVTAIKEQLGLRLEQGKVAEDILIVDSAERPRID